MIAISAENLSKYYRVYIKPFDRLKEALLRRPCHSLVTSLKDVSFSLQRGETLGIIGENGAGKSTLLKILAGTTHPSSGRLMRQGRIAALLELGSGFHPEFSGRTNIHLNAALLGLTEQEIRKREKSIIAFSELQDVIDRPVKTYSSGMYVRLAFSIATSVDPDVLIVDEALSVGDQRFAQKCVDRMVGFRKAGKTIIVCSHSMFMINELCEKTLWLSHGKICGSGKTSTVVSEYLAYLEGPGLSESSPQNSVPDVSGHVPEVLIEDVHFSGADQHKMNYIRMSEPLSICVNTRCTVGDFTGHLAISIEKADGQMLFGTTTKSQGLPPILFSGNKRAELFIPFFPFLKGSCRAKALIADENALRVIDERYSDPLLVESEHPEFGMIWMDHEWKC
jgi:lipopolysaccharide transport system ATP-binding protein